MAYFFLFIPMVFVLVLLAALIVDYGDCHDKKICSDFQSGSIFEYSIYSLADFCSLS